MDMWKTWKAGFDAWEKSTAQYLDTVLRNPLVLTPSGSLLSSMVKTRAKMNDGLATWWGTMGVSTKKDQERALHTLNQINSRLIDLEDRLAALEAKPVKATKATKKSA